MMKSPNFILMTGLPLGIILVGGLIVSALFVLKPEAEKTEEDPPALAVFVEPVQRRDIRLDVQSQGEARPRSEINLAAQVSGKIVFVAPNMIEGGFIEKGDILAKVEDTDYRLAVVSAESSVASARQRLEREQAEANIAERDWKELGEGEATDLALRKPQLAEARALLRAAEAQLSEAELRLSRTLIRAPFDGRVRMKSVDLGQFVSPGQAIGQIFATDIMEIRLPLNDQELGFAGLSLAFVESDSLRGPSVVLEAIVAGKKRQWNGRVTRTSAAIDPQTRQVFAIAEVEDPFDSGSDDGVPLAPGLFVNANIEGRLIEDILWAPRAALRGRDKIYVLDPETNTLEIKQINLILSNQEGVFIYDNGLEGKKVVISPVQAAFTGIKVTPIDKTKSN